MLFVLQIESLQVFLLLWIGRCCHRACKCLIPESPRGNLGHGTNADTNMSFFTGMWLCACVCACMFTCTMCVLEAGNIFCSWIYGFKPETILNIEWKQSKTSRPGSLWIFVTVTDFSAWTYHQKVNVLYAKQYLKCTKKTSLKVWEEIIHQNKRRDHEIALR